MNPLLAVLDRWARETPSAVALATPGSELTYAELRERGEDAARDLERRAGGVERVAVVVEEPVSAVLSVLASCRLDAVTMLVDGGSPQPEVDRAVARFGAQAVVRGDELTPVGDAVVPDMPEARRPGLAVTTSGVSGPPKVVQREWGPVLATSAAFADAIGLEAGEALLCTTPLHHTYPFCAGLLACLQRGATYVAPPAPTTPALLAGIVARRRVDVMMSVPLLYRWYLSDRRLDPAPRLFISAGDRLPDEVADGWREAYGRPLCNHYGTSEMGMISVDLDGRPGCVGAPVVGVEVRVEGRDVMVRPPEPSPVLLDAVDGRRADRVAERWFRTGDVGSLDEHGRLHLEGRATDAVNVGGMKIAPSEIEDAIRGFDHVVDAVVLGDERDGAARLCAFVEADGSFDGGELRARLAESLSPHKVPSMIRRVDNLPRTRTGKVRRGILAEILRRSADGLGLEQRP